MEKIAAIGSAGFSSLELLDEDLRTSGMSPAECAGRCADAGLSIELYQPFRRAEGVPRSEFGATLSRFHRELEVMRQLGTDSVLVVSNTDADADSCRDLSVSQLAALAAPRPPSTA
nr:TIM barrel protein [Micromonospora sp. DSM 115978]